MNRKTVIWTLVAAFVVFLLLFDIQLNPEFSMGGEKRELDPAREADFAACYGQRDKEIHAQAFGTIDNPDVQKLYISNNRAEAEAACRREFPELWRTATEPPHFNLFDLRFRL